MSDNDDAVTGIAQPAPDAEAGMRAGETYRHLRLMLVTLTALLFLSILIVSFTGQLEGSISAYYLGPIRDIFVGAMVGTAVCLIVYRGFPPFEDYTLNVAGFYAIFVAFVPTGLTETLASLEAQDQKAAIDALRVTIGVVILITIAFVLVEQRFGQWTIPGLLDQQATKWVLIGTNVLGAAFLVLVIVNGFVDDSFKWIHLSAAILLFVSLAAAVASHAWPGPFGGSGPGVSTYRTIFFLMLTGVPIALVLAALHSPYTVIVLEAWEIGLFSAFWILEAKRTWPAAPNN
ncbi:hypothetical protein ACFT2C_20265 [Promicromonospora sp. NPDC057138]|uniref:hypothetical protein n=1 Tax=Promicromonospora sp. NPDC057138 TaxID=3346031 RepID=UPI003644F2E6